LGPGKEDLTLITIRAAVALARAIERTSGLSPEIKWVNDLTVRGRKLSGILAEGDFATDGTLLYCALGVGVNLLSREFPAELSDIVTTVEDETGKQISADDLALTFVDEFYNTGDGRGVIIEYRRRSSVIGERVEVRRISGETFCAEVIDVTDSGALLVKRDTGEREELISAEVSIRKRNTAL
jgi:BirA family biotin operon repressor/biotin-[acetyl-CoA-carboxylase] ligase